MYSFKHDSVLSGLAHMRGMGFPSDACPSDEFTERQLRNLAGDAYSVPIISLMLHGLYINPWAPWWKPMGIGDCP